jgi:hypothetical protein
VLDALADAAALAGVADLAGAACAGDKEEPTRVVAAATRQAHTDRPQGGLEAVRGGRERLVERIGRIVADRRFSADSAGVER